MDWHIYDEELIRRGELILDLDFVESYHEELEEMNRGKVGAPYQLTDNYIRLLEAIRYLTCTGCPTGSLRDDMKRGYMFVVLISYCMRTLRGGIYQNYPTRHK